MGIMKITPARLCGRVRAIPSKSDAHRAIICALLARSVCKIHPIIMSDDIMATLSAAKAFGAKFDISGDMLTLDSTNAFDCDFAEIDCNESGSTMRFMLPVAAALGIKSEFIGRGRLPQRPITDFFELFPVHGAALSQNSLPTLVSGRLESGTYEISGNVSSQFITGLLMALPMLNGDSEIKITTGLESSGYIDMTVNTMKKFGVAAQKTENGFFIKGGQKYRCAEYVIDGDWSQAAFFLSAGALGGEVELEGLSLDSVQGDKEIFDIIKRFGADVKFENGILCCKKSSLHGIRVDASQIPDLVPAIAATASLADSDTEIYGAARLRIKESDRIKSVCAALTALGVSVDEKPDGMVIHPSKIRGGNVDCCNDHRIAMAYSVLAAYADSESNINGYGCISKSYPNFYDDFKSLGGICNAENR